MESNNQTSTLHCPSCGHLIKYTIGLERINCRNRKCRQVHSVSLLKINKEKKEAHYNNNMEALKKMVEAVK